MTTHGSLSCTTAASLARANIDHIAICRSGVWAIDAKNYAGRVQRIDKGGWFSTDSACTWAAETAQSSCAGMDEAG